MRILHTADWHLGDRLGRIDRTADLSRAVERVAAYCEAEKIDVLLVAGDLFSELARPDALREIVHHWQRIFHPFLANGGTVLTLTGNHDNESFCQTLTHAMNLAAPLPDRPGDVVPLGRFYLATEPTLLRLPDRAHTSAVQFLLMPYPTPGRYLRDEASQKYAGPEEKNRQLTTAFSETLHRMRQHDSFDASLPAVLGAHVHARGASFGGSLFRLSEEDDVIFDGESAWASFAYAALGHIHRPQHLGGLTHVRYCGSIERMDLGERDDVKSVVLVEIGPEGLMDEPQLLPLPSTPIYTVDVRDPQENIPKLRDEFADAENDLVNIALTYTAGIDNLEETLRQLEQIFPRWYARGWTETGELGPTLMGEIGPTKSFAETVRDYLKLELLNHAEDERDAILNLADALIEEMDE